MTLLFATFTQASLAASRQQALARGAALILIVVGLGVAVFTGLVLYAIIRRWKRKRPVEPREPTRPFDAWSASAERVEYERRADQYEDDDDDPDESTWYEDDGPEDDDSFGPSDSEPPDGPSGPPPSRPDDDDSFAGDDIPGKRLDF